MNHLNVTLILIAVQLLLYWIYHRHLRESKASRRQHLIAVAGVAFGTLPIITFFVFNLRLQLFPHALIDALVYPVYLWHFSSLVILLLWLVTQIVAVPASLVRVISAKRHGTENTARPGGPSSWTLPYDSKRRVFLRKGLAASAGIVFAGTAYAAYRTDEYEITEITIPVHNLPAPFSGFTIALISDIHSSVFMLKEQMQEYAAVVNSLGADLIAVPGDFVNSMLEEVYPFAEAFSSLRAPSGVYGVLGNHDFYTHQVGAVAHQVEQCGITLLRNRHIMLERGGAKIALIGIDDTSSFKYSIPYFNQAHYAIPEGTARVLLCHRPIFFDHAATRNVELMLSGHTHGGQVVFGRFGGETITPAGLASRYIAVLYTKGTAQMYVSRGVGTVGVPFRLNCPPEVTKVTLVTA
jgi:predicted MPP superfamily phosphohydrolase